MMAVVRRVGVVTALALAAMLLWYQRIEAPRPTVPVVIAAEDIYAGAVIDRTSVRLARWPEGTTPPGAYGSVDEVINRVTRMAVFKGEALVPGRLAPRGTGPGLEMKITPGKRAMSIRINDASSLAGLIPANSRVDILVVMDGAEKGRVAKLFMENMRVLAIGSVAQRTEDGRPINAAVATIEVTPEEGERLAVATTRGQIQLMLRGYGDLDGVPTWPAPRPRVIRPDTATVRVIRSYSRRGMQLQADSTVPRLPRRERPSP